ncbi:MAG TPA: Flp pilus assembly protein CpaB [Vicinamibacterales bacterium]|jgi:pilus assembly protein CpaB|nr:Flp pilus assembly protein CpaB [Vicinamibacterales bacterium]
MARIRLFAVFAIAIVAGGTFAFATYRYIQDRPAAVAQMQTRPVVVAAANLDLAAELRREDMKVIDWPAGSVPAGSFSNPQELVGRGLIQPVVQNAPILEGAMPPKDAGAGLPPVIPEGMRAVSVRVNDVIGVAGYVLPGTRVDVVVTISPTDQHPDTTSKVILTNVQVLTAGTKIERDTVDHKPVTVNVVTLIVDPQQAERLTLAGTEGKIQLALRNPLDKTAPETPGIRAAALLGYAPSVRGRTAVITRRVVVDAGPRLDPPPTVEIIRGDKRAQEVVR